jgi:hypothetical protein
LLLPNGQVLTADGETLIVAESAGQRLTSVTLTPEGSSPTVVSGTNATARLARFLLGHRRLVLLLWGAAVARRDLWRGPCVEAPEGRFLASGHKRTLRGAMVRRSS